MFNFLSWGHLLVLALGALFIFGPERLPILARDAAHGLKRLRGVMETVRAQVGDELGEDFPELRDLDLRRYHPRTFIRDQLFGDDPPGPPTPATAGTRGAPGSPPEGAGPRPLGWRQLPPPFDRDAT